MSHPTARPLLVTADGGIQEAVLAVAAEAKVELAVAADVGAAAALWSAAPLVLLDVAMVGPALHSLPVPRPGLVVVSRAIDDPTIWRPLVAIGAEHVVELPDGAPWLFERFGRSLDADPTADLLVVAGAVGGAGASTLAAALAHAHPRSWRTRGSGRPRSSWWRARPHGRCRSGHWGQVGRACRYHWSGRRTRPR